MIDQGAGQGYDRGIQRQASIVAAMLAGFGCGRIGFAPQSDATDGADAPVDAPGMFRAPIPIATLAGTFNDDDPGLTGDGLELFFASNRATGTNLRDIWVSTRASRVDAWGAPILVLELSSSPSGYPTPSSDGLRIMISRGASIFESKRADRTSPWNAPTQVVELDAGTPNKPGSVFGGGLRVMFEAVPGTDRELFVASRAANTGPWSGITPLASINTAADEGRPYLSPDGLTLYFYSDRGADTDIWTATRADLDAPFSPPGRVMEVSAGTSDQSPTLSDDQRVLVFSRDFQLFEASR